MELPQDGWFKMENLIKIDDLRVHPFQDTSIQVTCYEFQNGWSRYWNKPAFQIFYACHTHDIYLVFFPKSAYFWDHTTDFLLSDTLLLNKRILYNLSIPQKQIKTTKIKPGSQTN